MPSKRKTKHSTVIPILKPQRSPLHTLTGAGNLKTKQDAQPEHGEPGEQRP